MKRREPPGLHTILGREYPMARTLQNFGETPGLLVGVRLDAASSTGVLIGTRNWLNWKSF
jgi:hypothetical protein